MNLETRIVNPKTYHQVLKQENDEYVHFVYKLTRNFPREELYGVTSQLRRAALSIMLNYVEGYARNRLKVNKNFLEISYGSLQESKYLLDFAEKEGYIRKEEYATAAKMADAIGAMLWGTIKRI